MPLAATVIFPKAVPFVKLNIAKAHSNGPCKYRRALHCRSPKNIPCQTVTAPAGKFPSHRKPDPGWAEQRPEDWRNAVKITIKQILEKRVFHLVEIKGIGLSGQNARLGLMDGREYWN